MSNFLADPNLIPLLQGLKPFMRDSGKNLTEGVLGLFNMMTSHAGQSTINSLRSFASARFGNSKSFTVTIAGVPITVNLSTAFTLFLILILLILSSNLLGGLPPDPPGEPENEPRGYGSILPV